MSVNTDVYDSLSLNLTPLYRNHDEELVPRAYLVKELGSKLTIQTFLEWMDKERSPMTKLHGGAAFIDQIPIIDVCLAVFDFIDAC